MNMTVAQLKQTLVTIQKRRYIERKEARRLISWQTRTTAIFLSTLFQYDPQKGNNPVAEMAEDVVFDLEELEELKKIRELQGLKPVVPKEPEVGSYEKLMAHLGGGFKQGHVGR